MKLHRVSLLVGATFGAIVMAVAASFGGGVRTSEAQQDALAAAQRAQVMAAMYQIDSSGYHDLDVNLNNGEAAPAGSLGRVRRGRIVAQATMWPAEQQELATKLVAEMMALETALRDEDIVTGALRAKQMHDSYHDLSDQVYAWLGGTQPMHAPAQNQPQTPTQHSGHGH